MYVTNILTALLKINKEVCNVLEMNINILLFLYRKHDHGMYRIHISHKMKNI